MTTDATNAPAAGEENLDAAFDQAFAEAAAEAEQAVAASPAPKVAEEPKVTEEPKAAEEPKASETPKPAEEPKATETPKPAEEPKATEEPKAAETPKPAESPKPAKAPKPAEPPKPREETPQEKAQREAFEESIKPYDFTPEEKEALEKMKRDFPNEYAVLEAQMKVMDRNVNARVYAAVNGVLQQVYKDLTPVAERVHATTEAEHFRLIRTAHSDFDEAMKAIPDWVQTQPGYKRAAMQAVLERGDTQDVIDLVTDYKAATGKAAAPADTTPKPADAPKPAEQPKAAPPRGAEADDLAPVGGRRSTPAPKGAPDMNDFDGAFKEASAALG